MFVETLQHRNKLEETVIVTGGCGELLKNLSGKSGDTDHDEMDKGLINTSLSLASLSLFDTVVNQPSHRN